MEEQKRVSFSEIKVGIFVIISSIILMLAILSIGSQIGFFEETFVAKTYLNNVSGLKSGDIVLLGGVEVGNVDSVDISGPGDPLPDTAENANKRDEIARWQGREIQATIALGQSQRDLEDIRSRYQTVSDQAGPGSAEANLLLNQMTAAEQMVQEAIDRSTNIQSRLERLRAGLQNIEVYLTIKAEQRNWIRRDSSISLGSVGLLGDKYIEISLGRSQELPLTQSEQVPPWIPWIGDETTREVVLITGRTQAGFQELITGANDILTNFETLSLQLQDMMVKFDRGEGSIGRFVNDPSFYDNLNDTVLGAKQAVGSANQMLQDVSRGKGTIPRLIQEPELYESIRASADSVANLTSKIEKGEGTLGKIANDPALYDNANQVMATIREISERIEKGEGTLGKLSNDDKLYQDLQRTMAQLSTFVKDIEEGKGTLGRLAKDEQLYLNLNEVSSEIVKLIYDFRQNPKKFLTIKFELF